MNIDQFLPGFDPGAAGSGMHRLAAELFPICRSITGNGLRETLRRLQAHIPLRVHEVPSGTKVFDWTVPREWNIRGAYVKGPRGEKVVDFADSNLHVVNYSVPVRATMPLAELRGHLFSMPEHPGLTPYKTSYYKESWGFCLPHERLENLADGDYEVVIDSTLADGSLSYGEIVLPGLTEREVLISCHSCHPSLCNDNLSGIVLVTFLAKALRPLELRYTYRFLFIPGAIGSITWLALHREEAARIAHGLVVACVGDAGMMTYKQSRRANAEIDRAVIHVLRHAGAPYAVREFSPYGYDERQYCSPGFDLAVGSLTRTPHGQFPEYHTSADNLDFIRPEFLGDSLAKYLAVLRLLEGNRTYLNLNPHCEPQLGRRGLYRSMGGRSDEPVHEMAMLWVLNQSDGGHALLDIAERAALPFETIASAAEALRAHGLLREITSSHGSPTSSRSNQA